MSAIVSSQRVVVNSKVVVVACPGIVDTHLVDVEEILEGVEEKYGRHEIGCVGKTVRRSRSHNSQSMFKLSTSSYFSFFSFFSQPPPAID